MTIWLLVQFSWCFYYLYRYASIPNDCDSLKKSFVLLFIVMIALLPKSNFLQLTIYNNALVNDAYGMDSSMLIIITLSSTFYNALNRKY